MALSKTGRFLSKAEILGVGVFSPLPIFPSLFVSAVVSSSKGGLAGLGEVLWKFEAGCKKRGQQPSAQTSFGTVCNGAGPI